MFGKQKRINNKDWIKFFGDNPYPYTLFDVEKRDNTLEQNIFLNKVFDACKDPLLDAGCGYGRHAVFLKNIGYDVYAVDYIKENCKIVKKRNKEIKTVCCDLIHTPFSNDFFEGIYSMYTSLGYCKDTDKKIIKEFFRTIKDNGILCLDIAQRKKLKSGLFFEVFNGGLSISLKYKWKGRYISKYLCFRNNTSFYSLSFFYYQANELKELLNSNGFKIISMYGNYNFEEYHQDSDRLIILACKE
jgi:SAM-dependent methyltransferase